ncbi:MAG: protein kinase [Sporolactobacillus sp.]|jgi:serine/threonine protein kinase|nr:protein kinase [Sporolactobacillus sp.]
MKKSELTIVYNKLLSVNHINNKNGNGPWAFPYYKESSKVMFSHYGWKIHISATLVNALYIAQLFFDFLKNSNLDFKIISSIPELEKINSSNYGVSQVGKFITIYPPQDKIYSILKKLNKLFKGIQSLKIPSDYQFLQNQCVFYRYGTLTYDYLQIDFRNKTMMPQKLPFIDFTRKRYHLLPKYYLIIRPLIQKGGAGTYLGLDLSNKHKIILRYSIPLYDIDEFNIDKIDRLNSSQDILTDLERYSEFEKVLDSFYVNDALFLITKFVEGKNLYQILKNECVSLHRKIKIFKNILYAFKILKKEGIIYRDLSLKNIIVTDEDSIVLIDFEYAISITSNQVYSQAGTYGFYDHQYKKLDYSVDSFSLGSLLYYMINFKEYFEYENNMNVSATIDDIEKRIKKTTPLPKNIQKIYLYLNHHNDPNYNSLIKLVDNIITEQ